MRPRSLVDYFSQEIIDSILDNFRLEPSKPWEWVSLNREYPSNLAALNACSLVCRAFTPRCQYHLFSTVHLNSLQYSDERPRREGVYNMLLAKPHVASGIRRVSLALDENGIKGMITNEDLVQPSLLLFLRERELTSVQLFTDALDFLEDSYPDPRDIEECFFRPFIRTSFITSLDIAFTEISATLLAYFPNLVSLSFHEAELAHSGDYRKIAAPQPRARLQTLRISSNSNVEGILRVCGSDALPLLDLSQLRVLQPTGHRDTLMLNRVFDICAQSLEEFDVSEQCCETNVFCGTYSLAHFQRLSVLSLRAHCTLQEDPITRTSLNPFIDQCRLLATIPSPNPMQKVFFTIIIKAPDCLPPLRCLDVPGWDDLDARFALIAGPGGKPLEINVTIVWTAMIRRMVVHVDGQRDVAYDKNLRERVREILLTALVPAIREKFQRVQQSPNIVFDVIIDSVSCRTIAMRRRRASQPLSPSPSPSPSPSSSSSSTPLNLLVVPKVDI